MTRGLRTARNLLRIALILCAAVMAAAQLAPPNLRAAAQSRRPNGWSDPLNLSRSSTSSSSPAITSDQYGFVHVFWSEDLGGPLFTGLTAPNAGTALMYRRLSNGVWSDAIDITYAGENSRIDEPAAVVDKNGLLHVVWLEEGELHYSSSPVWDANKVRAWSTPVILDGGTIARVRLVDFGDSLLAVYSVTEGEHPGLFAIPLDQSSTTPSTLIWEGTNGMIPMDLGAALDGRGRMHIVWSVILPPNPGAVEVRYSYSENLGESWSESRLVAQQTSELDSLQFAVPWVAARGDDEIHLQWAQGDKAYRRHQYSTDGGKTWASSYQIWPDLLSQTNSQATGVDADGNLFWADVLRPPNGAYLIPWGNRKWGQPEMFLFIDDNNPNRNHAHELRMTILQGKEMYVAFQDQDHADVWIMSLTLPAIGSEVMPVPQPTPTPRPTPEITPAALDAAPEVRQLDIPLESPDGNLLTVFSNPGAVILAGALPVILLFAYLATRTMKRQ